MNEHHIGAPCAGQLQEEFRHLKAEWGWLFLYGVLLVVCGTAAFAFPVAGSLVAVTVLGISLMIGGVATIIASIWAGKWSGMLVQLLVGILYLVIGYMVTEQPLRAALALTMFVAAFCIVVGIFRSVAAMSVRYPYWGWSLLNGLVTFLLGVVIYRHFPTSGIWVLGLLVGLEMLLNGWTWIMLSLAIKKLPAETVSQP